MKVGLRRLFCKHDFVFHRVTGGDENIYSLPYRKIVVCTKCNSFGRDVMTEKDWEEYKKR